jgi:hypothetical protein
MLTIIDYHVGTTTRVVQAAVFALGAMTVNSKVRERVLNNRGLRVILTAMSKHCRWRVLT